MRNLIYILIILLTATTAKAQSPTRGGGNNQLQSWYGGFKVIRYLAPPNTFNPWTTYDSLGMVWIDSTTTKKLMWHTGVYRRYVASERYVDSLFATAVTGVTQQTLDDSCAAVRSDITGGSTDSSVYSTKAYRQKGIDSVNGTVATRVKYTDTAAMLLPYQRTVNATSGTVTSVATGYGAIGGTITTTGTISADTAAMATRDRVQKAVDSLNISIGTKGSGTVTNVATNNGTGITGGAITGTGTIAADTTILGTRLWRNKGLDSVAALIPSTSGFVPYTGATGNVDLGAHRITATRVNTDTIEAVTSAGVHIHNTAHEDIMIIGAGGGKTASLYGGINLDGNKIQNSTDTVLTTNSSGTIGKAALASVYLKIATAASTYVAATTTSVNTVPITSGINNTITASAATLTTTTLNPTVVTSSLTSVGTIGAGTWSSTIGSAATGSTQAINNNSTQIATTAYVDRYFPVDTTISAAYTLTSRDFRRTIHCTNGSNIALTIPTGLGTTFECVVLAEGAGTVTPTTSSTTFYYQPTSTTKISSQGGATIRSWATANSYLIIGSLE